LSADCGAVAQPQHLRGRRWRVTVSNDRVSMWVEYEALSRGRLQWAGSQLFIDGNQVPKADSYGHFLQIFADPDADMPARVPVFVDVDPGAAPPAVRSTYQKLVAAAGKQPGELRVAVRRAGRQWLVCVENERMSLRCRFETPLMNPLRPLASPQTRRARRPLELVVDGQDRTEEINGRIDKALAMMLDHPAPPARPAIGHRAPAAVNTGVAVRRQSVIRV
jgi:hypothetical protein